jgi:hypothetical protein
MAKAIGGFLLSIMVGVSLATAARAASVEDFYQGQDHPFRRRRVGRRRLRCLHPADRAPLRRIPSRQTQYRRAEHARRGHADFAANYIFNSAPRDGTYIGHWSGPLILQHMMGNPAVKFEGRKFGWLGMPTPDSLVCITDRSQRHQDGGRLAQGQNQRSNWGPSAPAPAARTIPSCFAAAAGFPMQLIEGFKGTADIRAAAEQGEVDGTCAFGWQSAKVTWANAVRAGQVHVVLQTTLDASS